MGHHVRRESPQIKEKPKEAQGILRKMQPESIFLLLPTGSELSIFLEPNYRGTHRQLDVGL